MEERKARARVSVLGLESDGTLPSFFSLLSALGNKIYKRKQNGLTCHIKA
jgi:hypothetical protein